MVDDSGGHEGDLRKLSAEAASELRRLLAPHVGSDALETLLATCEGLLMQYAVDYRALQELERLRLIREHSDRFGLQPHRGDQGRSRIDAELPGPLPRP